MATKTPIAKKHLDVSSSRTNGEWVVLLKNVTNVPRMDPLSLKASARCSDVFCTLTLRDKDGKQLSTMHQTQVRRSTINATFMTYVPFSINPVTGDVLEVVILDFDIGNIVSGNSSEEVGRISIKTADLMDTPKTFNVKLTTRTKPPDSSRPMSLTISLVPVSSSGEVVKEFFWIRHGESQWNAAEKSKSLGGKSKMLNYDHPLSRAGIEQALNFNQKWKSALCHDGMDQDSPCAINNLIATLVGRKVQGKAKSFLLNPPLPGESSTRGDLTSIKGIVVLEPPPRGGNSSGVESTAAGGLFSSGKSQSVAEKRFLLAERIYSSPLTRAIQTAMLTCYGHPAMNRRSGMRLERQIREVKNTVVSLDTVGVAIGDDIASRVLSELGDCLVDKENTNETGSKLLFQLNSKSFVIESNSHAVLKQKSKHKHSHFSPIKWIKARRKSGEKIDHHHNLLKSFQETNWQMLLPHGLDVNDCDTNWWTEKKYNDWDHGRLERRLLEMWHMLKYSNEKTAILVGHSIFFREAIRRLLAKTSKFSTDPRTKDLASKLKDYKLDNASCLYVKIKFHRFCDKKDPAIELQDAELIFGTDVKVPCAH